MWLDVFQGAREKAAGEEVMEETRALPVLQIAKWPITRTLIFILRESLWKTLRRGIKF